MVLQYSTPLRNARANAVAAEAGNAALLRIYTAPRPANVGTAITSQTLLAELTCGTPFATSASAGVQTLNVITQDTSADAGGTASWFRLLTNGGTAVLDGDVSTANADLNLNTVTIVVNGPVQITSAVFTEGGA